MMFPTRNLSGAILLVAFITADARLRTPREEPWAKGLVEKGFTVQEGKFGFFDLVTCSQESIDTCYAANALTPYGLLYLPNAPGETATEADFKYCRHGICKTADDGQTLLNTAWRVKKGEAILVIGTTPPECEYWSLAPSVFSRYHQPGWKPHIKKDLKYFEKLLSACPQPRSDGDRCELFASVGDPLNHLVVKTASSSPFESKFAVLLTWDSLSEESIQQSLEQHGLDRPINRLRYPGSIMTLGTVTGKEDDFTQIMRVEGVVDEQKRREFFSGNWDMRVFRISPPETLHVPDDALHASMEGRMRPRLTNTSEHVGSVLDNQDLQAALHELASKVKQSMRSFDVSSIHFDTFVEDSGYECLSQGLKCQGDCRDTIYARATLLPNEIFCNKTHIPCKPSESSRLSMADPNDSFVVVGVLHGETGQAIYSSISAYDYPKLAPVGTLPGADLVGSAASYLGPDHPAARYLYVATFKRSCLQAPYCSQLDATKTSPTRSPLSPYSPVVFIERCYVNPATLSGPAVVQTILPILFHIRSPHTPEDLIAVA